jgi:hypothetical protein
MKLRGRLNKIRAGRRLLGWVVGSWATATLAAVKVEPWTPIFAGVELAGGAADAAEPRLQQVRAVRIDLRDPDIEFFATPSNGDAPLETTSETTSDFVRHYQLQLAINANFFSPCCSPGDKDLVGLAMSHGVVVSPPVRYGPGDCVLAITKTNHAVITRSREGFREADYWTAVAGSDIVLEGGVKAAIVKEAKNMVAHPRTAVGVSRDGHYLIWLVIDGRQPGYSVGATLGDVADWLVRFGANDGLNLDGGGSTTLVRAEGAKVAVLNQPSGVALGSSDNTGRSGGERQLRSNGNNLGVFARPLLAK